MSSLQEQVAQLTAMFTQQFGRGDSINSEEEEADAVGAEADEGAAVESEVETVVTAQVDPSPLSPLLFFSPESRERASNEMNMFVTSS